MKIYALILVSALLALAWVFRWDITPIDGGESSGRAYLLNRLTGTIYYLDKDEKYEVNHAK